MNAPCASLSSNCLSTGAGLANISSSDFCPLRSPIVIRDDGPFQRRKSCRYAIWDLPYNYRMKRHVFNKWTPIFPPMPSRGVVSRPRGLSVLELLFGWQFIASTLLFYMDAKSLDDPRARPRIHWGGPNVDRLERSQVPRTAVPLSSAKNLGWN